LTAPTRQFATLPSSRASRRQGGFTLIEMTIALLVTVEVILAGLALFDFHNKLARVQTQISDMQQSMRISQYEMVRLTRMAGRGSFPAILHPGQLNTLWGAVSVRNNVGGVVSQQIAIGYAGSPTAVLGSDILTLRGVFSTSVVQATPTPQALTLAGAGGATTPATATSGTLIICGSSTTGILQNLTALETAVVNGLPEAIILVSPASDFTYAVVELNPGGSDIADNQPSCPASGTVPNGIKLAFNVTGDANANAYQALGSVTGAAGLPATMSAVLWVGILEEYRYYARQDYVVPGNTASDWAPHLSRARMYPGTETPYQGAAANLQVDVADNVLDLQVSLGVDLNGDGVITEDSPPDNADEWLGNAVGDTLTPQAPLREVRISTLAKTGNRDPSYQATQLTQIEDHVYTAAAWPNTQQGRAYRRRLLQTVVGLRNL
jgi:Tfp pilus assembly protein FimT